MGSVKRKNLSFIVAYLIGVSDKNLLNDYEEYSDLYDKLSSLKEANIIRYLSRLRTSLLKNFKKTDKEIVYNLKNINSLSWFDNEEIDKLEEWGISIIQANCRAEKYSSLFCTLIEENIDNCRFLFPEWLDWSYIRELFVVPNSSSKEVLIKEFEKYISYISYYPYSMYIHWDPFDCKGMLLDDGLFLKSLFSLHGKEFNDKSKYKDVSDFTSNNILDFINNSEKVVIAVDCENTDVYKLYGFLSTLSTNAISKIEKMVLYDDENTVETWKLLSKYTKIPVEYLLVDRVLNRKSLVDIKMTAGICESHYKYGINSFIIVSSDSDYCGVISSLPSAKFMVVYENIKSSNYVINGLKVNNVLCCSLDDFYSGDNTRLKEGVIQQKLTNAFNSLDLNFNEMLDTICKEAHIDCVDGEKKAFYNKFFKSLKLFIDKEGNIKILVNN